MQEDYEEFILLTLRTRSSKKPLGMLEEIGNTNGSRHALQDKKEKQAWETVARLMISSQNLRVSWKPVNPQDAYGRISTELS